MVAEENKSEERKVSNKLGKKHPESWWKRDFFSFQSPFEDRKEEIEREREEKNKK